MEIEFDGRRARYTHEMPVDAYTGDAVCLPIEVERWGLILPKHLEEACEKMKIKPAELKGMVVCLNTGMHRKFDDSKEYYHYSCGTGIDAGRWFVKNKVKCVAMDMQALDHPLHTAMGNNGMTRMNLIGATGKPSPKSTSSSSARKPMPSSINSPTSRYTGKSLRQKVRRPGSDRLLGHLGTLS